MITVTLNQIRNAGPRTDGWEKVLKANGGNSADMDKPFSLISMLDSNDLYDTLWVIDNVPELKEHESRWLEFSCWCAMQNIDLIKPYCSDDDYKLIVTWLSTRDPELREAAKEVARVAERLAVWSTKSAARLAAESAVWSTESARLSAKSAAKSTKSAWLSQQEKLIEVLTR